MGLLIIKISHNPMDFHSMQITGLGGVGGGAGGGGSVGGGGFGGVGGSDVGGPMRQGYPTAVRIIFDFIFFHLLSKRTLGCLVSKVSQRMISLAMSKKLFLRKENNENS